MKEFTISFEPDDIKTFRISFRKTNLKKFDSLNDEQKKNAVDAIERFVRIINVTKKEIAKTIGKS